ncbi:MAG: hypothetical protein ABSE98_01880 [Acidimicrobiales bacterium]|jgi:hypothetical protein
MPKPISTIGGANDATQSSIRSTQKPETVASTDGHNVYVMPIVHVTLPESAVNAGFWAVLVGAAALGAIDLPLAALIGTGVLIARHHR